jgi:lysophospholipase L1-like esterase
MVTNDQGFISLGPTRFHYAVPKPAGTLRVVVLGGSTVAGMGSPAPEGNLPAKLSAELTRRFPKREIEVVNAGVLGYTSNQELLYLYSELSYYEPDLVVVYDGWNDEITSNILLSEGRFPPLPMRPVSMDTADRHVAQSYTVGGSLASAVKLTGEALVRAARRLPLGYRIFPPVLLARAPAKFDSRSAVRYRENLEHMRLTARQRGFKIAFFLQPLLGVDEKKLTSEESALLARVPDLQVRRDFYAKARAVFRELEPGGCAQDLSNLFSPRAERVYADFGHLNPEANVLAARAIAARLDRCGFFR